MGRVIITAERPGGGGRSKVFMPLSVETLSDRAARGDHDALAELLERCGPRVKRRMGGRIPVDLRPLLSVDDLMQETYKDAFLDIGQFHPCGPDSFIRWLTTLAERNLIDAIRAWEAEKRGGGRRRVQPAGSADSLHVLHEQLERASSTPSHRVARAEAYQRLRRAIEQLPPTYRRVVELYDLQGWSAREVAGALDRSEGAVYMLRSRAHRYLNTHLGPGSLYFSDTA